jgi:hypothetical protein
MFQLTAHCYRYVRGLSPALRNGFGAFMALWVIWITSSCYGVLRTPVTLPRPDVHPAQAPVPAADTTAGAVIASVAPSRPPALPISITRPPVNTLAPQEPPPEAPAPPLAAPSPEPATPKTAPKATTVKRPHYRERPRVMMARDASGNRIIVERHENFVVERPAGPVAANIGR